MGNKPKNKTQVSESEVIDPHLKIVCELKDEGGNTIPYDDDAIASLISNLQGSISVRLKVVALKHVLKLIFRRAVAMISRTSKNWQTPMA